MSHPSWVCGLKHVNYNVLGQVSRSHPSWVWIETRCIEQQAVQRHVTPFVGVWIETYPYAL